MDRSYRCYAPQSNITGIQADTHTLTQTRTKLDEAQGETPSYKFSASEYPLSTGSSNMPNTHTCTHAFVHKHTHAEAHQMLSKNGTEILKKTSFGGTEYEEGVR